MQFNTIFSKLIQLVFTSVFIITGTSSLFAIELYRSKDETHSLNLSGVLQADGTIFMGKHKDRQNELPSGATLRRAEANLSGKIAPDWAFSLDLDFDSSDSSMINAAFVSYTGFSDNTKISIGQVPSPFILENANSSKWIPLLERSMVTSAFRSDLGLGANAQAWTDTFSLTVALTTPKSNNNKDSDSSKPPSDRLTSTARLVFSPVHNQDTVYHLGISGIYGIRSDVSRDKKPFSDIRFKSKPEAVARNTPNLLDTGSMRGTNFRTYALEAATRLGPLFLEAESFFSHVHRTDNKNVNFHGHYVQAAYVLTGESREYNFVNGSFGKVVPNASSGAWEIATRYSHLDLNDHDVHGGRGKNLGFALNWYANKHLKLSTNYIFAHINPSEEGTFKNPTVKRNFHIIACRAQLVW